MQLKNDKLLLSASDLSAHLGCAHLTELERLVAAKKLDRVVWQDPMLEVLQKRGFEHEAAYLDHLRSTEGRTVVELDRGESELDAIERTKVAMADGPDVITQATLSDGRWRGRADVLRRVERPSNLGAWSYEVVDTKLASETKAGTILQLCLYSELIAEIQGLLPERMYVVSPGRYATPEVFRTEDFLAYHRQIKRDLLEATTAELREEPTPYPEPCSQCDYCDWWGRCDRRRRDDDHLSLIAGATRLQRRELEPLGLDTLTKLAGASLPLDPRPNRGTPDSYVRIHAQARVQLESRGRETPTWEILEIEDGFGLTRLPEPSPGDLFFDFEGDPFVADGGREYLFGWVLHGPDGSSMYEKHWALTAREERREFESFIDYVMARLAVHPDLHIYHFGAYEPGAFKRLMGRYATRESEVDQLLRGRRFVDLHSVLRQAMRVGVERYSLKDLEPLHSFKRELDLREASRMLRGVERALELGATESIPTESRDAVEAYNRDDCLSTLSLRDWLEQRRTDLIETGQQISRPPLEEGDASEKAEERNEQLQALYEKLTQGLPEEADDRTAEQQAQWVLAHMLEWHRREDKASWWEFFRLAGLVDEELLEEKNGIGGLQFLEQAGKSGRSIVERYAFAEQEHGLSSGDSLYVGEDRIGSVEDIDKLARTIDIKKTKAQVGTHPTSVFAHDNIRPHPKPAALERIAQWVADNGIDAEGPYRAARDLLLRASPRLSSGAPLALDPSVSLESEVRRLATQLDHTVLAGQGPPGAGKTYLGARMICALAKAGKRVAVTAVSHKVIRNLLDAVAKAADAEDLSISIAQKKSDPDESSFPVIELDSNPELHTALESGDAQVAGATSWAWSRDDFEDLVDVLVVDEAGQMSLADTLASATTAKSVILLGDPQQLDHPIQGSHPDGCAASALEHLLGEHETMPEGAGLFLEETWRLHPSICAFTSEVFYEGRLQSRPACAQQELLGDTPYAGAGLWWLPVQHRGNQSSSVEEVDVVEATWKGLVSGSVQWRNADGEVATVGPENVLIVAPYNLQVNALTQRLGDDARIGTVDKFQGQEAAVVIYSMTTSSPEDAPRGMEFLYDLNRLNVATSRARCGVVLVASPELFEPGCRNPRQMRLANAVCRFREMAGRG